MRVTTDLAAAVDKTADTEGYRVMATMIAAELERARLDLEDASKTEPQIRAAQGYAQALRWVLKLPIRIQDAAKANAGAK